MIATVLKSWRILSRKESATYFCFVLLRVLLNFLDLLGLALIGILATQVAAGGSTDARSNLGVEGFFPDWLLLSQSALILAIVSMFSGRIVLSGLVMWATARFLARIETSLATRVTTHLFSGELGRIRSISQGELLWLTHLSPQHAIKGVLTSLASIIADGSLFVLVFVLFSILDPLTSLSITGYLVAVGFLYSWIARGTLQRVGAQIADSSAGIADSLQDLSIGLREVRVSGALDRFVARFYIHRAKFAQAVANQTIIAGLPRLVFEAAVYVGVATAGILVLGDPTQADYWAELSIFLAGGLRLAIVALPVQNELNSLRISAPQAEKAFETLREIKQQGPPLEISERRSLPTRWDEDFSSKLSVSVRNVCFAYKPGEPVLKDFSLEIAAGSLVALTGPSGAGKSTLANLILGLEQPKSGEILVGGLKPEKILNATPSQMAYVPQEPVLLSGTMIENITMFEDPSNIDFKWLEKCLDDAAIKDFIESLPNKLETRVSKRLDSMSGGQKQRLGLARALYTKPSLLVLDEFTSALDSDLENQVSRLVRRLTPSVTVLVIAHRKSTIDIADGVVTLRGTLERE